MNHPDMQCNNEFCLHHVLNSHVRHVPEISEWNKTQCTFYEIDPYGPDNKDGIRIDTCPARLRFCRMWALEETRKKGWG